MEKIRAYELSKIFGFPSKNIVNVLHEYGVSTKNHMSALSEYELDVIFEYYTQKNQAKDFSIFDKKKEEPKEAAENVSDNEDFTPVPEIEVGRKLRTVDTRVNNVDLDRIDDEKIEELIPENVKQGDKKQKINQKKKQQQRQQHSTKQKRKPENVIKKVEKKEKKVEPLNVLVPNEITVGELASRMKKSPAEIIKKLMLLGIMATVNETLDFDTASLMVEEFGGIVEKEIILTDEEILFDDFEDTAEQLKPRSPVVVVMGHVDHGKTSLLDAIRDTNVTEGEFGGITQHIGAHRVRVGEKKITFLDTPGHEAFTAMRARGALVTDIAILVVAADDGIMPQTIEAINHAKAAEVSIIVAINKIDKDGANPDKVKQELMEHGLVPEEWGGDTICVEVSAKKRQNIKELLEMVLLVAEMKELKANPDRKAKGTVIESQLDKGRGSVATVLVQNGTLHVGDYVVAGTASGRVRAMNNDKGKSVKKAGPSIPVEILGLSEVPEGGDEFYVVEDERKARSVVENRKFQEKKEKQKSATAISLDNLFEQIEAGKMKDLNIVVKADVQGSVEAVKQSLERISNDEVRVNVIHGAVGAINESDVMLASASNAIIVGFNVRPTNGASDAAEDAGVDLRMYRVIYDAIEDIEKAMKGMLEPTFREEVTGHVEIRTTFKVSGVGTIGGAYVLDGKIRRDSLVRVVRDGIVIHEGELNSLKRFKDDVKEVNAGYECGLSVSNYNDIKDGDIIEAYIMAQVEPE
ncbi:translation initiation factor IF-2 [Monoglobus pectinilyticus]|uniref:Translation initiation factor IF-2 n=2 Tax=Monoglobus pectinilyticus TaxID=1981510 RepID=A0A2K9P451_9FIRM|nr:translation initiation factor IF-2 [Monoglobus pectinilyticus]AUO20024.1 translation initiation factor IF-2 [Monoglobus pectinilyticus]MBS6837890.1 translation initiation factor IF-2 [Clostridiales bacterium]MEE0735745.1 translation initiation factor IF-2 [Monoglobus pectinilyticus]PWL84461.1 MAG: translation initiation factor IF-2 [Clostridiales bacterium]